MNIQFCILKHTNRGRSEGRRSEEEAFIVGGERRRRRRGRGRERRRRRRRRREGEVAHCGSHLCREALVTSGFSVALLIQPSR